jgi:hypothetical protein
MNAGTTRRIVWAMGVMVGLGCEPKQRDFVPLEDRDQQRGGAEASINPLLAAPGQGGASSEGVAAVGFEQPRSPLGTGCQTGTECDSGFCVDGVCCNTPCADICATCGVPGSEGTCSPAAGDSACDVLSCGVTTECRGYADTQLSLNCEALGVCRSGVVCSPVAQPQGLPCREGLGACDGQGECLVPGTATLGEACSADVDCGSEHCVTLADGSAICCETACDGVCQECSVSGRCDQVPATDVDCSPVVCPSDNVCRDYPDSLTDNLCRALGQCRTNQDCAPTALRVAANCDCDANGACGLSRGVRCDEDVQCSEGACVLDATGAGICCATACGPGLICASDGSGCLECIAGAAPRCEGATQLSCNAGNTVRTACPNGCTDGIGCNDRAAVGFLCDATPCVAAAVCQNDTTGAQRCCSRDCAAEGKVCAEDGSCVCLPGQTVGVGNDCLLQQGDPCGSGATQCGTGLTCVDGVCCNDACNGACERCTVPGSVGQCAFDARDTTGCGVGEQCVAQDDCRGGLRERCAGPGDCVSGICAALRGVSGAQICCAQQCGGQRPFCSTDGTRCIECEGNADCASGCATQTGLCNPLRVPGATCTVATQCASGACLTDSVDATLSRCCGNCGAGQRCDGQGRCVTPPAEQGRPCNGGQACGAGLFCVDGVCCNASCQGVCESCTSSGTCQQEFGQNPSCPPGQQCASRTTCAPRAVLVGDSCANGEACPANSTCNGGRCTEHCLLSSMGLSNGSFPDSCVLPP